MWHCVAEKEPPLIPPQSGGKQEMIALSPARRENEN
jgi:hypothetical protein